MGEREEDLTYSLELNRGEIANLAVYHLERAIWMLKNARPFMPQHVRDATAKADNLTYVLEDLDRPPGPTFSDKVPF